MMRTVSTYVAMVYFLGLASGLAAQTQINPVQAMGSSEKKGEANMAREFYTKLKGSWKGSYSLWLRPGTPAEESQINANFRPVARGNYFLMVYSWKLGEEPHEGVFLFGGHGKTATATWGDSFHMVPEPMQCPGRLADNGKKMTFDGSYAVGDGPAWGWRTEFTLRSPDDLLMEAYNITPDGVEALAVRAEMKRASRESQ